MTFSQISGVFDDDLRATISSLPPDPARNSALRSRAIAYFGSIPLDDNGPLLRGANVGKNLVVVPRGGVKQFAHFSILDCPTHTKRPIESQ